MLNRKKTVPQPSDYPEVMNQVQVALLLGLSRSSVQEYTKNGTIPHLKLGRRCLYSKTKVLQWVEGGGEYNPKIVVNMIDRILSRYHIKE